MADSDSSPESTTDDGLAQSAPDTAAVAPAESPAAETPDTDSTEGAQPKSMVDAVHSALEPKDKGEDSPASSPDQDPTKTVPPAAKPGEQAADPNELTEAEKGQLKGRTKRSFERLTSRVDELGTQNEQLRARVTEYDKVVDYIRSTKLKPEELDTVFDIATTMKAGNPHAALQKLTPIVVELQRQAGLVLPPDLVEQVRQGYLTEQHARELSQARSAAQHATAREQYSARERQEAEQQAQYRAHMSSLVSTADDWERQKTASDPDWNRKAARVHELAKLEVLEKGPPPSAQHAVAMFNRIYERVSTDLRSLMPRPTAVRVTNGAGSSARSVAEPKSMLDAVRLGIRGTT